jgi:hypothetical protein
MEQGMIVYHPFDDVYHCFCRLALIMSYLPIKDYEIKKLQILDFYFLFPGLIKNMRFPKELMLHKAYVNNIKSPYTSIDNPKELIMHLEHQVIEVIHHMASHDIISVEKLKQNSILCTNQDKFISIIQRIGGYDTELLKFLTSVLAEMPLNGRNGLKARTGLFEERYDNG